MVQLSHWVVSSPGESGFLAALGVLVLWSSTEVMADHHLQPRCLVCLRYVDASNILLLEAIKKCVLFHICACYLHDFLYMEVLILRNFLIDKNK